MTPTRFLWLGLLCCAACSKKEPAPRRTEPWLAQPSAAQAAQLGQAPLSFHFTPESSIRFTLPGKKGNVSGRLPLAEGTLRLDPRDLKSASASIDVDLTKLSIDAEALPEGVELGGSSPNALALQWLELGADVAPQRRREVAQARFELTSVETLSASNLDWGARRTVSSARASIVGTLLIHGFRAPIRSDVVVTALPLATGGPRRLSIRSAGALVVPLAPHDISARGPSGTADPLAMLRSAAWVGKNARVEFELVAEAEPLAK